MSETQDGRATIFEVAESAGVSITTVSHVFSGKRRVNERTRQHVLAVADRLAYRPRATAQALATGRTNTLALQISATGQELVLNPFFNVLVTALSLAAIQRDFSFVYVPPREASRTFIKPLIGERRIDAAVLVDPVRSDPFVKAVARSDLPFVSIGRVLGGSSDYWVDNDNAAACKKVLAHLEAKGYERPALLTVPMDLSYIADYVEGFHASVGEGWGPVFVAEDLSEHSGHLAALRALDRRDPPDALVCIHDRLAVGALLAASQLQINVPDELGVVGVSDTVLAANAHPPLTSLRVFPDRAAARAIELVDALLRGAEVEAPAIVPTRLITRASTARPSS